MDPSTHTVYVTNDSRSTVSVINGATNASPHPHRLHRPDAVAVDPSTHTAYVANYDSIPCR